MTMNQYIVYLVIRINVEILMCLVIRSHGSTSTLCNSHIVFSYNLHLSYCTMLTITSLDFFSNLLNINNTIQVSIRCKKFTLRLVIFTIEYKVCD